MAKITPITEHFQHFLVDLKESFWGDLYDQTKQAWKQFLEAESERMRDLYSGWGSVPGQCGAASRLPQRLLQTRFCHSLRDPAVAHCAHPGRTFCRRG